MIAILTTHPIQYQVPLWRALAEDGSTPFEVWYLSDHGTKPSFDEQFGKTFAWDIDMLAGYPYRFLKVNRGARLGGFTGLRLAESLGARLREQRVKALWIQGWQVMAYWQAVYEARRAGAPVWLRGESNDLAAPPRWKKLPKALLLRSLFSRVDKFLYIGQANRRLYQTYGVRPEQLHPAPYCVDNERFASQAERHRGRRADIRRGWNIPDDAFCVLFAAKFIEKKRPLDLIRAARQLAARNCGRPPHLLFVGAGEMGGVMRQECRVVYDAEASADGLSAGRPRADAPPAASFVGFLNQREISKAYAAADCMVLPSDHRETWGLVVNEAMASGLACAVSDACGCGEDLVAPIRPELRFPLGDEGALADALLRLAEEPCPPSVLRQQVDKFGMAATVDTIKSLYAPVASRGRKGPAA